MTKKVAFGAKPQGRKPATPDEWVAGKGKEGNEKGSVETTRFTIDIPTALHARIKSQCALRRVKMRDEIQALLEKHFPASQG
jgi:hypothetical protein